MNILDVVILAMVALAAFNGFRRGAAVQVAVYAGLILGLVVGAMVAPPIARLVGSPFSRAILALGVLLAMAAIGDAAGWFVGGRVRALARRSTLSTVDSVAGSAIAVIAVLVAVWFIGLNLATGPFPVLGREVRGSAIERAMSRALPPPPPLLAEMRQLLNRLGFPEVFADLPPAPAGPVPVPSNSEIAAAVRVAERSTVRIVGEACGSILEGSGFVVSPGYVVTNAHVVAGVRSPTVQVQNGGSQPATTVLFDPTVDLAVLLVAQSPGPPLVLDPGREPRAAKGAVVGYPGGGPLRYRPAAILRDLRALGRDIYGRRTVTRDVYELQAVVIPGNSGGPFILSNGEVGGVVWAASTTDSGVGYALTSTEVAPDIHRAESRTRSVSTGSCVS